MNSLRLHRPTEIQPATADKAGATEGPTLSAIWDQFWKPKLLSRGAKKTTLAQYQSHVRAWVKWTRQNPPDGLDSMCPIEFREPPASLISQEMLQAFQEHMLREGLAKITARNRCDALRAILREAAKRNLIERVPEFEPAATCDDEQSPEIVLPYEHVDAIYRACSVATWPETAVDHLGVERYLPVSPAAYWRLMVVWLFTFGMRVQDLVAYQPGKRGLTWREVWLHAESPRSSNRNRFGWFFFVPQKTSRTRKRELVLPLSEFARLHLDAVRPSQVVPSMPVFPFPVDAKRFRAQRQAIMRASGVMPKPLLDPGGKGYLLSHFRATCATWYDYHAKGSSPASAILGHAGRGGGRDGLARITARHYVRHEKKIIRAVRTLPQPESFSAILHRTQGLLFDV